MALRRGSVTDRWPALSEDSGSSSESMVVAAAPRARPPLRRVVSEGTAGAARIACLLESLMGAGHRSPSLASRGTLGKVATLLMAPDRPHGAGSDRNVGTSLIVPNLTTPGNPT